MPSKVYRLTNLDTNEVIEDVVARKAKEIIGASGNVVLNRIACKKDNVFENWKVEFQQDIRPFTKKTYAQWMYLNKRYGARKARNEV